MQVDLLGRRVHPPLGSPPPWWHHRAFAPGFGAQVPLRQEGLPRVSSFPAGPVRSTRSSACVRTRPRNRMRMFRSAKISHGVNALVWMVREMSGVDRRGGVGEYEQGVARDNAVRLRQDNLRLRLRFACHGIGMLLVDVFCWRFFSVGGKACSIICEFCPRPRET